MDLSETQFIAHNTVSDFEQPEDISDYCSLTAPPNSTLWRKPLSGDDVTAPMILTRCTQPFILAEVTVTAEVEVEWDQAGLVIFVGMNPNEAPRPVPRHRRSFHRHYQDQPTGKWLKVGLELIDEDIGVATAVAQPCCGPDWSFTPIFPAPANSSPTSPYPYQSHIQASLRIKLERVGQDLWVWYRIPDSYAGARSPAEVDREWKKARELSEFFGGVEVKSGIWVGCYASRPLEVDDGDGKGSLFVEFEGLEML
jgi:regulation of enolase protein 1 (concanavalin A-like superfamily)